MKILIVGGNGTIGKTLVNHFNKDPEVIVAGRNNSDVTVNISESSSIQKMLNGYVRSILGKGRGEIIRIYD